LLSTAVAIAAVAATAVRLSAVTLLAPSFTPAGPAGLNLGVGMIGIVWLAN